MENNTTIPQQELLDTYKFVRQAQLTQVLYQEGVKAAYETNNKVVLAPQAELMHMLMKDLAQLLLTPYVSQDDVESTKRTIDSLKLTLQLYADYVVMEGKQMSLEQQ